MSLNIYFGNDLKKLLDDNLLKMLEDQPLPNPLQKEIIIVQNQGMAIWLKQLIANKTGITCNVDFPFINGFINEILEKSLSTPPDKEYFHPYVMTWKIWELLGDESQKHSDVHNYLQNDKNGLKKFQLATQIAHCFDQYQIYRSADILNNLNNLTEFPWQKSIWEKLSEGKIDRATGFETFLKQENDAVIKDLQRISIVGIFSMPPIFIDFFEKLAKSIDVNIFLPFSCNFKNSSNLENENLTISTKSSNKQLNPFLDTLGNAGIEFLHLLNLKQANLYPDFRGNESESALSIFKSSLQYDKIKPLPIPDEKFSTIQIHNCHSKMREVEVLRNNILHIMNHENIQPSDILVMMPNIADYSPYIKSVFDRKDILSPRENLTIPYTITDNSITFETQVDEIFKELLNIHKSRFEASFVLNLLEQEVIYKKLQLSEEDAVLCRKWISETNIRWGINGNQREQEFGLVNFDENSWEKGLNRMFLGFCLKDDDYPKLHYSYLPYDMFEGHNNFVLGKLSHFISLLMKLHNQLKTSKSIPDWQNTLFTLIDDFFYDFDDYQKDLKLLRKKITKLTEITQLAKVKSPVSIEILQYYFQENLSDEFQTNRYFRGGITFSTLQPLRNIPAKVICILGMNDNEFPRNEHYNSFNLLGIEKKIGDRIKREEDQYLFLEAITAAEKYLFISYMGQNIQTNEITEPASPVCELQDYLKKIFPAEITEKITVRHKLQSHNSKYFSKEFSPLFSYSKQDFDAQTKILVKPFHTNSLLNKIELNEIFIDDLIRHLSNSAQFFVENVLGARIKNWQTETLDAENFSLDNLEKYSINQFIQSQLIKKNTPEFIYDILKAQDALPVAHIGKQHFEIFYTEMTEFLNTEIEMLDGTLFNALQNSQPTSVDFKLANIRFFGKLPNRYKSTMIYSRYASFNGKDALKSWIYHLLGNINFTEIRTICITKSNTYHFPPISVVDAKGELFKIVELYKKSFNEPLPFFPRTSLEFIKHKPTDKTSKINKAKKIWSDNYYFPSESEDDYFQLFFNETTLESADFETVAKILLSPFMKYFPDENGYKVLEVKK